MSQSPPAQELTDRQHIIDGLGITIEALPTHSNPCMDNDITASIDSMDHWSVQLLRPGYPTMTLIYSMGIGHRRIPSQPEKRYPLHIKTLYDEDQAAKFKPVKPKLVDVLYSLISDSSVIDFTFEEWCGEFGYDIDSRKAEHIFRACSKQGKQIRKLLGNNFESIQVALQDY